MTNEEYITQYADLLKLLNKEEAIFSFIQQQPESLQSNSLKQEIEELRSRIGSNEDQKNKLQGSINYLSDALKKLETSQKKEIEQAKTFCDKRDKMLASLPPPLRKKATQQFNALSQSEDEVKSAPPQRLYESANFLTKLLHGKKIKQFDQQFENIKKDAKDGHLGNFDTSSHFDKITDNINKKYDSQKGQLQTLIAERKKSLTSVDENIGNDKTALKTKEQALSENEKVLNAKINQFSDVYNTNPFIDNTNIDPAVQKALNNGQIQGSEREKQIFVSLLSTACQNSDIAKEVLHSSIEKGTKFFIQKEEGACGGHYSNGIIVIDTNYLTNLNSEDAKIAAMTTMIHEARHSCQDCDENIKKNNWANTIIQSSLKEVDAYTIETAATYQLNQHLRKDKSQNTVCEGHQNLLNAFSQEYEKNHDMVKALNAAACLWNKEFGYEYKSQDYIQKNWCHLDENAKAVHPKEIAQRNNINFQGKPYLDIEKVTNQILTLDKSDYDEILHKLELSGKKDDSLQYFSIKTPELKKDEKGNIQQDEFGMDIIDYKITSPSKHFNYPIANQNNDTHSFYDMSTQQKSEFILTELRQGKNSHLEGNRDSIVQSKEKTIEQPNVITPLRSNRGMEM